MHFSDGRCTNLLAIKETTDSGVIVYGSQIHVRKSSMQQIIWLWTLTAELGIPYFRPTILNVDNQGAIDYSYNAINHSCTKHIDIQHHFIHEKLIFNEIGI
jgi:hypothetical protein